VRVIFDAMDARKRLSNRHLRSSVLSGRDEEHISALQRNRGKHEFCDGLAKLQGVLAARCNLQQVHVCISSAPNRFT
jgi:hypothetical protein